MNNYILIVLLWNIAVMLIYGADKLLAKMHRGRISEKILLLCAFFLGGGGAVLGMILFNHKTSKMKFRILVPIAGIVSMLAIYNLNRL